MKSANLHLQHSSGAQPIDEIIRNAVGVFEATFPRRIRGYYLSGSYADQAAAGPLSDIDLCILFKGSFVDEREQAHAALTAQQCAAGSLIRLDAFTTAELALPTLHPVYRVALKYGSLCLYGEDIRDQITLPTITSYTQGVTDGALHFIGKVLRNTELLTLPLDYPDSTGEFYGYDQKRIANWYPATISHGTKELVACMTRIATAIIAIKAQGYVASKTESIRQYRLQIGDQWAEFLDTLYEQLKQQWHYLIPTAATEQVLLRLLGEQALAFENHFLTLYQAYLLELASSPHADEQSFAAERLRFLRA
jgi:hypothetical protein